MTNDTPTTEQLLTAVDLAISAWRASLNAEDGEPAVITGWVLVLGEMTYDLDGEPLHGTDYAIGPTTNQATAVGLLELGKHDLLSDALARDEDP